MLKKNKSGRYRYFKILIFVDLMSKSKKIWSDINEIQTLLKLSKFVSQTILENTLSNLKVEDNGRIIKLKNFSGSLRKDTKTGLPFWNIVLYMTSMTTSRKIGLEISNMLYMTDSKIHPTISITPINNFEESSTEDKISLPNTCWYPGYFTKRSVNALSLLSDPDVQQAIENHDKYKELQKLS